MRPVDRGEWPLDPTSACPIQFQEYGDAKPHLLARLGYYCSYCEMRTTNVPAVEHKHHKSARPDLERMWCNLLLSCGYCNPIKGHPAHFDLDDYFWPDQDNTARAIVVGPGGVVNAAPGLHDAHAARALRTIALVGLDRTPGGPREPSIADERWKHRHEAWETASEAKRDLAAHDTPRMRQRVVDQARHVGFWSVWMAVFADDEDMRRRLIDGFPGTSRLCFDERGRPVARPGGAL